jgi:hypothetical protein
MDFVTLWDQAQSFDRFVADSTAHRGLWEGIHRIARVPDWVGTQLPPGVAARRLLVIAEDWCGDASNTIPVLAKWADRTPGLELRLLRRDEHPDVMDRYLTNGARAIPVVIVLDEAFEEIGHWGPRPEELQSWVMEYRQTLEKKELYPQVRRWYARDRGDTTIREIADLVGLDLQAPTAA